MASRREPASRLPIIILFSANAISMVGNVISAIAIPWFVLQTTGSASKTGIAAFFTALPAILAGFFGGTLVDRLGYRKTSVIADLASGVCVALIPLLYNTVGLAFWQLLMLVFLGALLDAPGTTAREVLVPDLAERCGVRLEWANSFNDGISRASRLVGAPLAGLLIALLGPNQVLWLDAASFAVSAILIGLFVSYPRADHSQQTPGRYFQELAEGFHFLVRDRLILSLVATVMVTNLIDGALFSVILPAYVKEYFGSALPLGLMISILGGAAVLGTLIFASVGHRIPRRLALSGGFTMAGIRFWALALFPGLPVLLLAHAIAGLGIGPINPLLSTVEYERIPASLRARVFGTITAGVMLIVPLGVLVSGYLLEWVGMQITLVVLGAGYLLASWNLLVNPRIREIEKQNTRSTPLSSSAAEEL